MQATTKIVEPSNRTSPSVISPKQAPSIPKPSMPWRTTLLVAAGVILVGVSAGAAWYFAKRGATTTSNASIAPTPTTAKTPIVSPVTGPTEKSPAPASPVSKNYGDKYANGLLPVGDNKYTTSGAKKGSVYLCNANFVPASQAGAQSHGPWFTNNNTQWDMNKKSHIAGNVTWTQQMSVQINGTKRLITTNDLPNHSTGVYPVAPSDPARVYDANPNTIKSQSLAYNLTANPVAGEPTCMGGEVGVMLTGVALFNAFDAGGRDAGAWEVQDGCDGHPQSSGEYHYHTLSRCIKDVGTKTVIGYALDGFPITGPKVGEKNILTTEDLDECHGITSEIIQDSIAATKYHYVMTQDFPYSVSCFRSAAIQPPGQQAGPPRDSTGMRPPR